MALIPSDAGIRMRMQTEAQLQPLAPIRGIPSDLPDLQPGQIFSARIQQVLPDNTYRALVAGKELTLALPQAAKAGDTLELVVTDRSAKAVMAQLATPTELKPGVNFTALIQETLADNTYRALVGDKAVTLKLNVPAQAGERLDLTVIDRSPKAVIAQLATPPELKPGTVFTALIQEALPDNTYRARVGGKTVTLKLDIPAREGEHLELTLINRSSRLLEAQVTGRPGNAGTTEPYPFTRISPAARFIGQLLVGEGQTPKTVPLNGGQPILAAPPQDGAELAPRLAQAVSQSGLFYEAHQAQWVAGKLPTEVLLKEPQGQQQVPGQPVMQRTGEPLSSVEPRPQLPTTATPALPATAEKIPDALLPLVQQQLDAAATQRLLWHGEIWPGQTMEWEIQRDAPEREADEAPTSWSTRLALTTPRLGRVDATLQLGPGGLRIAMTTDTEASAANLRQGSMTLTSALDAAGIPLLAFLIRHGE